jgi:hypothetical protein
VSLFIRWPLLAFVPGLLFLGLYRLARRRVTGLAGVTWLLYGLYELGMRLRWLCSGECNIRVDLLLIYPALAVVSLLGLIGVLRGRSEGEPRSE